MNPADLAIIMRALSQFKRSEWLGKWFEWFKWCWQRNVGGGVISTPATRPRTPCLKSSSTSSSGVQPKDQFFSSFLNFQILFNLISIISTPATRPRTPCLKSSSTSSFKVELQIFLMKIDKLILSNYLIS